MVEGFAPIVALLWHRWLLAQGRRSAPAATLRVLAPLLLTFVLLFSLQGDEILRRSRAWYEGPTSGR